MSTKAERREAAKILSDQGAEAGGLTRWAGWTKEQRDAHMAKMRAWRWAGHVKAPKAPRVRRPS